MKTAEEWYDVDRRLYENDPIRLLKKIQADALRHAAEILGSGRSERTPQSIRTAWANVINAEADKLETK